MIPKIQPCLWFDKNAEEAAHFYAATFPATRIDAIHRAPGVYLRRSGQLPDRNGGSGRDRRYWKAILDGGGKASACGWCKDRFGLSWQITPKRLTELISQGGETAARAFTAMMDMGKIDIAALDRAVAGYVQAE